MVSTASAAKKQRFSRKAVLEGRQWSPQQKAVFDFALNGAGHALVEAKAGSGKTTQIVGAIATLPASSKIAVVAFNVHSVQELAARLPSSCSVATAHKFGMSALVRYFGGKVFQPNENKYRDLADRAIAHLSQELRKSRASDLSDEFMLIAWGLDSKDNQTRSKARGLRRSLSGYLRSLIHFTMADLSDSDPNSLLKLDDHFCIEKDFSGALLDRLLPYVPKILDKGMKAAIDCQDIDLDELLYLPVQLELDFPAYDFVFWDEAQDGSAQMRTLISRMAVSGRLFCVADRFQAVQGFAGSDAYSVDRITEQFQPKLLPLSVCYRCPSAHLELARKLVPGIQDHESAIAGTITTLHPEQVAETAENGDLIICRFTAPLIGTCLELITKGIRARVRGRDIGKTLTAIAEAAYETTGSFPQGFDQAVRRYCKPRIESMKEGQREKEAESLEDRMVAVLTCFESFGFECSTFKQFGDRILQLFCDDAETPPVVLATIHRSKGDESNRVFILGSNFLPYTQKARHDWQKQQELNLTYVALTRSKNALFLVPLGKPVVIDQCLKDPLAGLKLAEQPKATNTEPSTNAILKGQKELGFFSIGDWVYHDGNPFRVASIDVARSLLLDESDLAYPASKCAIAIPASVAPDTLYQHPKRPGWLGKLYAHPYGFEGVMIDIIWIASPGNAHEDRRSAGYPDRYPVRDLIAIDSIPF